MQGSGSPTSSRGRHASRPIHWTHLPVLAREPLCRLEGWGTRQTTVPMPRERNAPRPLHLSSRPLPHLWTVLNSWGQTADSCISSTSPPQHRSTGFTRMSLPRRLLLLRLCRIAVSVLRPLLHVLPLAPSFSSRPSLPPYPGMPVFVLPVP